MAGKNLYSKKEMLKLYKEKYKKLGRPPTTKELIKDPNTPSYTTYWRRIGNKREICNVLKLPFISIYDFKRLCSDCLLDPKTCNQSPKECMEEARLYYFKE
ncbi:MAG: homing endonuclease associated repeat-containing protein [bacterium]